MIPGTSAKIGATHRHWFAVILIFIDQLNTHIMIKMPDTYVARCYHYHRPTRWGKKLVGWVEVRPVVKKVPRDIIEAFYKLQLNIIPAADIKRSPSAIR